MVALTADDQAQVLHHFEFQKQLGLPLEWISAAETRRREPHLADRFAGALWSPQDHQVDNRKLAAALKAAAIGAGAQICEQQEVKEIVVAGGRAHGVSAGGRHRDRRRHRRAGRRRLVARHRRPCAATCGRRCARSRGRCWRCAWTRARR